MPLTFEQARSAFQNAIPRRRDEFERKVHDRLQSIAHESQYPQKYPVEVLRVAQDEVRMRHELAGKRIKELLDSGWQPVNANAIRSTFIDMFAGFDHWSKDPSSDIYQRVDAAFNEVGRHDPEQQLAHRLSLGRVQVDASNEVVSDLEMYAGRLLPTLSESMKTDPPRTITASAEVEWKYDAFISHASDDKATFVNALANALRDRGVKVWFDAFTLTIGDSLRESIDEGLRSSRYGIVVLSRACLAKPWPKMELEGLVARQNIDGRKVILPIWHGLTYEEVASHSPILAGRLSARSSDGLEKVVADILEVLQPR